MRALRVVNVWRFKLGSLVALAVALAVAVASAVAVDVDVAVAVAVVRGLVAGSGSIWGRIAGAGLLPRMRKLAALWVDGCEW